MTLIGRERTVDKSERASLHGQCSMCGREAACRFHSYSDQLILCERPIVTYDSGRNQYCRYCSDGQVVVLPDLSKPELTTVNESRGLVVSSATDLYRVDFHRVSEEGLRDLVAYIRSNDESSLGHGWAGQIEQISAGREEILTEPVLEVLRWWTVQALEDDDSSEQARSRYYDVFCDVRSATEIDRMDAMRELGRDNYGDEERRSLKKVTEHDRYDEALDGNA